MSKSIFYHAGCPVCVSSKIPAAEKAGVASVPALVTLNGNVLHLNFGASMADVKG